MLRRRYFPAGIGQNRSRRLQHRARTPCVRYGCTCTWARPNQVPASGLCHSKFKRLFLSYLRGYGPLYHDSLIKTNRVLFIRKQGFGTLLMEEAERIAREEHGSIKLAVISGKYGYAGFSIQCPKPWIVEQHFNLPFFSIGVGTRDYYRKLGYELDGPYMSKSLL